jgi:glycosyltransferase involved in cell wall biosynthesis
VKLYWFSQSVGPERGLEDVVRAMGRSGRPDLQLHVRGSCDESYRRTLLRLTLDAGLARAAVVFHEPAAADEMIRLAAVCDVGLALEQPSTVNRDICLTNKIFTYLLAGNAIVATATKGQRPLMEQITGAGFCFEPVEPGDVEALAQRLRTWCERRDSLVDARLQAWDWGTRRFNWECERQKFIAVVEKVLRDVPRDQTHARV